jgi:hypothetical protein
MPPSRLCCFRTRCCWACCWRWGDLFETARQRWIALGFFWGFSGMDVLGQWFAGGSLRLHLESWAGMQFSSHVTQAFWAPQHALAGWLLGLFYLLWREGRLPLAVLLSALPLTALLSPLALLGGVPFGVYAMFKDMRCLWRHGVVAMVAGLISLPTLLYLTTSSGALVSGVPHHVHLTGYPLFIVLEIGAYLLALWFTRPDPPFGRMTMLMTVALLLLVPFGQIGDSVDFTMRASIPALLILCLGMVRIVIAPRRWPRGQQARGWILAAWLIGLATPGGEIWRALTWPASPEVSCGYPGVVPSGMQTYQAPRDRLPAVIRPAHPAVRKTVDPAPCWQAPWRDPISGQSSLLHPY